MNEIEKLLFVLGISGLIFFIFGLLLGRRWKSAPAGGRSAGGRRMGSPPGAPGGRRDGPVEIYVGNLSLDASRDEVQREFAKYGKVLNLRLIAKRGEPKGFGFVEMAVPAEADEAIKALHGRDFKGSAMEVNIAKSPRNHRRPHRR